MKHKQSGTPSSSFNVPRKQTGIIEIQTLINLQVVVMKDKGCVLPDNVHELKGIPCHICECRCNERLKAKTDGSTCLV